MKALAPTQWRELSALYDEAEELDAPGRAELLSRLRAENHPLRAALSDMLDASRAAETDDFLTAPARRPRRSRIEAAWAAGDVIGSYRLLRPLGSGGMAEVWLAERVNGLRREVALKIAHALPRSGAAAVAWALRFDRERDILASLRHTHIAGLLDAGVSAEGQPWLALEYVQGESIDVYCDARQLTIRERVQLMRQVLLAVQHAHTHLVVHRDLKPSNILVTRDGEVRLLDFGIAKLLGDDTTLAETTELTRQSGRLLTPRYASPEQVLGRPLGTRSDVYSLGVLLYELLCGSTPYELRRQTIAELERAVLEFEPHAPSRRALSETQAQARSCSVAAARRELAPELDAVVLRALAKSPERRYSSVDALLSDIDRWLAGEAVLARTPSPWLRLRKFSARHRWGVALGTAAVFGMVLLTGVSVVLGLQAKEQSARALAARDFVFDMFRRAEPEEARGQDISARDLLAWGQKHAIDGLAHQPALQADVLQRIVDAQNFDGDDASAQRTYAALALLYRRLNRPSELAMALAGGAEATLRLGDTEQAALMLQDAELAAPRVPAPELALRLESLRGLQAASTSDFPAARQHYLAALEIARRAWGLRDERSIDSLRGLADAERNLHDDASAIGHLDEASALAANGHALRRTDAIGLTFERLIARLSAGRYADAAAQLDPAYRDCVAHMGRQYETCGMLIRARAVALMRLGDDVGAQALLDDTLVQAGSGRRTPLELEGLVVACRILAHGGRSDQAAALWHDLEQLARDEAPPGAPKWLVRAAARARAEAWLLAGDPRQAEPWLKLAGQQLAAMNPVNQRDRAMTRVLMGQAAMLRREPAAALDWFSQAQADAVAVGGELHPLTQMVAVNRAATLLVLGRAAEARPLLEKARPVLAQAFGSDAPTWHRVAELESMVASVERIDAAPVNPAFFFN